MLQGRSIEWSPVSSHVNCSIDSCFFKAADRAIFSASAVDSATVCCFLVAQLTVLPATFTTYPVVDFLSVTSPPQSASVHISIVMLMSLDLLPLSPPEYTNPISDVPFR